MPIKTVRFFSLMWIFILPAVFWAGAGSGLIIYRFGGEGRPVPPEADSVGVDFRQRSWTDLDIDRRGQAIDLDMDAVAIRALERDPTFNLAPVIEELGGSHFRKDIKGEVWDGDPDTAWFSERYLCNDPGFIGSYNLKCIDGFGNPGTLNTLLGGFYRIDRIRVVSGLKDPAKIVGSVRVYLGSGKSLRYGNVPPFVPGIVDVRDNREQFLDIPIPPREEADFVQVQIGEHNEDWEINEIEIYARGFVKESTYISNIIDFERPMAWGDLRWFGTRQPKGKVFIQTRSGRDDDPDVFWRLTGRGGRTKVTRAEYDDLKLAQKAGATLDRDNWAFWSAPYDFADSTGTPVVSLSPRRFFQFKVNFRPQDEDGGQVDFLEFRASEPVASDLVGEVWPIQARVGQPEHFTYALWPTIRAGDAGFNQLEIRTSSIVHAVKRMRIGDMEVSFDEEVQEPHRRVVTFPRLEARDSGALVEVEFEAQVLRYGATFDVRVSDSDRPLEVPQGVNAGDATAEYEGNRVSVATAAQEQDLLQVQVAPAVFTPNGDGFNDGVEIGYDILEITGSARVWVEVLDLSGRRVRQVYAGADKIGVYARAWDGRDDVGRRVPPGIYLYRISVDAAEEKIQRVGVLHAAY